MHLFRQREFFLLFLLVFGLQFCHPMSARAGDHQQMAMEICSTEEAVEADVQLKLGIESVAIFLLTYLSSDRFDVDGSFVLEPDDRINLDLLPASGLYPAAP